MIKQEITYKDVISGQDVTETFYFHLNAPETFRLIGHSKNQDWESYVQEIAQSGDSDRIMDFIESFVKTSVGQNIDGRLVKTAEFRDAFLASEAYGQLFVNFIQDEAFTSKFFESLIEEGSFKKNENKNAGLAAVAGNRQQRRNNKQRNK